jgi:hypothetical protein
MRVAAWAMRVLLLVLSPLYYLCRIVADSMSRLDQWAWRAIHEAPAKKPPRRETTEKVEPEATKKTVP